MGEAACSPGLGNVKCKSLGRASRAAREILELLSTAALVGQGVMCRVVVEAVVTSEGILATLRGFDNRGGECASGSSSERGLVLGWILQVHLGGGDMEGGSESASTSWRNGSVGVCHSSGDCWASGASWAAGRRLVAGRRVWARCRGVFQRLAGAKWLACAKVAAVREAGADTDF